MDLKLRHGAHLRTAYRPNVRATSGGEGLEFAAEVQKTTDGEAGAPGWVVTYTSGGETKRLEFPLATRLCSEDEAWVRHAKAEGLGETRKRTLMPLPDGYVASARPWGEPDSSGRGQ